MIPNSILLDKTCIVLTCLAKIETSYYEIESQQFVVNFDNIIVRSYQSLSGKLRHA